MQFTKFRSDEVNAKIRLVKFNNWTRYILINLNILAFNFDKKKNILNDVKAKKIKSDKGNPPLYAISFVVMFLLGNFCLQRQHDIFTAKVATDFTVVDHRMKKLKNGIFLKRTKRAKNRPIHSRLIFASFVVTSEITLVWTLKW